MDVNHRMVTFTSRNVLGGSESLLSSSVQERPAASAAAADSPAGKRLVTASSAPGLTNVPASRVRRRSVLASTHRERQQRESTRKILHVLFLEEERANNSLVNAHSGGITLAQATKILCQFGTEVSVEEVAELYREVDVESVLDASKDIAGARVDDSNSISRIFTSMLHSIIGMSSRISTWSFGRANGDVSRGPDAPAISNAVYIQFDSLMLIFEMWQSAAGFRMFEMREERAQRHIDAACTTRTLLKPDSAAMFAWHSLVVISSLVSTLLVLEAHVRLHNDTIPSYFASIAPIEIVITAVFVADIIMNLATAMVVQSDRNGVYAVEVVDDIVMVAKRYLFSMWFFIDLLATLPLRFIFFAGGDPEYCITRPDGVAIPSYLPVSRAVRSKAGSYNTTSAELFSLVGSGCTWCASADDLNASILAATVVFHFRLLKFLRTHTVYPESGIATMSKAYIHLFFVVGEGVLLMANLLIILGICCSVLITIEVAGVDSIASAVYVIMTCFSTAGYGDFPPVSVAQRGFFCALFVISALLNGIIIGNFVSFFQASDMESKHGGAMLQLANMLEYFHVPMGLQDEILQYYSHDLTTNVLQNYGYLFVGLPTEMQSGLELWSRLRLIQNLPTFHDLHRSAKLQLCQALQKVTYCPEEYIVYCGEIGEEMFFLSHGFVDIYTATSVYVATLRQGSYFGEMAIMSAEPQKRGAHVKSITYSEVFVLRKDDFMVVLKRYPKLRVAVEDTAHVRQSQMNAAARSHMRRAKSEGVVVSSEDGGVFDLASIGGSIALHNRRLSEIDCLRLENGGAGNAPDNGNAECNSIERIGPSTNDEAHAVDSMMMQGAVGDDIGMYPFQPLRADAASPISSNLLNNRAHSPNLASRKLMHDSSVRSRSMHSSAQEWQQSFRSRAQHVSMLAPEWLSFVGTRNGGPPVIRQSVSSKVISIVESSDVASEGEEASNDDDDDDGFRPIAKLSTEVFRNQEASGSITGDASGASQWSSSAVAALGGSTGVKEGSAKAPFQLPHIPSASPNDDVEVMKLVQAMLLEVNEAQELIAIILETESSRAVQQDGPVEK